MQHARPGRTSGASGHGDSDDDEDDEAVVELFLIPIRIHSWADLVEVFSRMTPPSRSLTSNHLFGHAGVVSVLSLGSRATSRSPLGPAQCPKSMFSLQAN